jgi:ABC-type transport system involved in cytochrome bd biosynthesis fused ATPase/permease subunit
MRHWFLRSAITVCFPHIGLAPKDVYIEQVGENGGIKSTLAMLLAAPYHADAGSSLVGRPRHTEHWNREPQEHVCYAPPPRPCFDTTLASDLRVGEATASDDQVDVPRY